MAANRNQLMPQLQECERVILPSVTISRVALDHALRAEGQIQVAPHDFLGMMAKEQGATPAGNAVRVETPSKATGLLTQTGHAGGGVATPVGPIVRVKSSANQAVHTGQGHLPFPQDAPPNVTRSWSMLTAPRVIGDPPARGLPFSPTSSPTGLAPNGGAFGHPNGGTNGAGSVPANQFGEASRSTLDELSRKRLERLEHENGELQPGRPSSPPQRRTDATSSVREHDDKKAEVETVISEDSSPLRPPSPDSNAGLQGTRFTPSADLVDGSEATLADTYSDPLQPTPEPKGRRSRLGFLNAILKIRALWRF
jgi:hypothetical protein